MQNNLFFLCGPHGSGKTTFGQKLAEQCSEILIPELYSRNIKFNIDDEQYRQYLKICSRAIENFEYLQIAKKNPNKMVLANRCIYGVLAYNLVYYQMEWISEQTYKDYNFHSRNFFRQELREPYAIIVNPGFDKCREHLEKRWKQKGKKWREKDMRYLELACKSYEQYQDSDKVFYIDYEPDLEARQGLGEVYKWMKEKIKKQEYKSPENKKEIVVFV
jgi:thymidylate kinase